ncbi:MAG: lipopolysaccharide biosynthesis protein [Bacteroidaceae bacterium]|nr:lipopolysaccharide biosynthesis protein [Bacteroidaceae bacterium]
MEEGNLKQRTARGLIWGGLSGGAVQLLNALFGLVLLNRLSQEDYGMMAILVVFSNVAGCIQESGFTAALANKKEAKHEDYNAVFWFDVIVGSLLYLILSFAAPAISRFYHEPSLTVLARFVFLNFWIVSIGAAHYAYMFSHMMVRQNSIINIVSLLLSGIIGIVLAFCGFAYWALAIQNIAYVTIMMVLRWYYSPWRPTLQIDLRPAWQMWGFSWKLLVQNLFLQLNNNVFGVLLGRFYTARVAGVFSNARKWNDMAVSTIGNMVLGVAQPTLTSADNGDMGRLREIFRKMLRFTCFVSFPCLLGLSLISEDFIFCLIPKWSDSAPLLSTLCIYGAFAPVVTLYSNLVISRGQSMVNLVNSVVICILIWAGLIAMRSYGVLAMTWFYVGVNTLWVLVWQFWARRLIGLRFSDAARDILPFFLFAAMVMILSWWLTSGMSAGWLRMGLKILLAVVLYIGILWVFGAKILSESIAYIINKKRDKEALPC